MEVTGAGDVTAGEGTPVVDSDTFPGGAIRIADTTAQWTTSGDLELRLFVNAQVSSAINGDEYAALSTDAGLGLEFSLDLDASAGALPLGIGAGQVESFRDDAGTLWAFFSGSVDLVAGIYSAQSTSDGASFGAWTYTQISNGDLTIASTQSGTVPTGFSVVRFVDDHGQRGYRAYLGVESGTSAQKQVYTATSSDLLTWALEYTVIGSNTLVAPFPLTAPSPLASQAHQPFALVENDGRVTLFYNHEGTAGHGTRIWYSTSEVVYGREGVVFSEEHELMCSDGLPMANSPAGPTIVTMPDGSLMLYVDSGAADGSTFIAAFALNRS